MKMHAFNGIVLFLLLAIWIHPTLASGDMDSCPECSGGMGPSGSAGETGISITFTSTGNMGQGMPYSNPQPYSSSPASGNTLVQSGSQGTQDRKPGDGITLTPQDRIELQAKCQEFVSLVKANMGKDRNLMGALAGLAWAKAGHPMESEFTYRGPSLPPEEEVTYTFSPQFEQAFVNLVRCVYTCGKLYSGGYGRLTTQSASRTPLLLGSSASPAEIEQAQIGLNLVEGPFLAEVVNDKVTLDIETDTVTVVSMGKNTFGLIRDPASRKSIVVAYQDPVTVEPKNYALAPFTLNGGQMVMVDAEAVSPVVPFISTPDNAIQNGSNTTSQIQSSRQEAGSIQKLKQIKDMLDAGLITQEDYDSKKEEILSQI